MASGKTMGATAGRGNYAILILHRADGYELHIRELLLWVTAPDLQRAFEELTRRRSEFVDLVRSIGGLDEMPAALPAPSISIP